MATSSVLEKVTVQELSKYGFKANDVYYNWGKKLDDKEKTPVVPGGTFEMDIYIADSGKKYVNHVGKQLGGSPAPAVMTIKKEVTHSFVPKKTVDSGLSKEEWAAKDVRISRQGCIQVAVQVCGDFDKAVELADKMLAFVNQK